MAFSDHFGKSIIKRIEDSMGANIEICTMDQFPSAMFFCRMKDEKVLELVLSDRFGQLQITNIGELEGLSELKNLSFLDLSFNKITEISGLDGLVNLKTLNLRYNKITEIKGLDNLKSLDILDLFGNDIKISQSTQKYLEKLPNLRLLILKDPIENLDLIKGRRDGYNDLVEIYLGGD
ncbi:MAG: hypothetical protein GF329_14235 [Candidatus Lokiarchaeota archaeon]|nr:hypothetical protein [Candidatus Lokiarchaeota archaeon]